MDTKKYTDVNVRGTGIRLMIYTRSLELCARMNYETENLDFIDKLEEGSVLYDLGACEGRFSIYAAARGIRVYSFEPDLDNFSVLKENIALNSFGGKIGAYNLAVGHSEGQVTIRIGQPWSGGHQKVVQFDEYQREDLNFDFKKEEKVRMVALDRFIREEHMESPDYLKIDIDGSEMPFLTGARNTLQSGTVRGIIFELSTSDPSFEEIISHLQKNNYNETARYPVPNEEGLFNIVFARKE